MGLIAPFLSIMQDYTDGCANQYCFVSDIYILICIALEFYIIIDRAVGAPGNVKYVVDGLNTIYKWTLKLSMSNILNTELIRDDRKISSSCRFMKTNYIKLYV